MPTYQRLSIYGTNDLRAIADHAGSHFFSPGAMRAFSSRLLSGVYAPDGHQAVEGSRFFFVTSERYDNEPRHYAVRVMTLGSVRDDRPSVDIMTVGGHYDSAREAHRAAKQEADTLEYLNA